MMKGKAVKTVPNSTEMTAFKRDSNTEIFRFDFSLWIVFLLMGKHAILNYIASKKQVNKATAAGQKILI